MHCYRWAGNRCQHRCRWRWCGRCRTFFQIVKQAEAGDSVAARGGEPDLSDLSLFDRRGRPITLTPAGQVLRRHAHKILETVSEAQTELAELNLTALPKLSLSIVDDFDISLTPALVSRLQAQFRNCFVSASSGRSDLMVQDLVHRLGRAAP